MDRKIRWRPRLIYRLFLPAFIFICFEAPGQNCTNFDRKCPLPDDRKFERSSMSRSVKIRFKQKQPMNITLFEGKEYYISVCGKSKLGNIQLKVLSGSDRKVIYDNAANGFADFITIKSELTQKLIFEVSAPAGKFDGNDPECIGFYVASCKLSENKLSIK